MITCVAESKEKATWYHVFAVGDHDALTGMCPLLSQISALSVPPLYQRANESEVPLPSGLPRMCAKLPGTVERFWMTRSASKSTCRG